MQRNTDILPEKLTQWGYLREGVSVEQAISWYQQNHIQPLDELTQQLHKRSADYDGVMGPGTAYLINSRFCDVPDTMPNATVLEANIPFPCRGEVTISWNFDALPGLTKEQTDEMWAEIEKEFESQFDIGIELRGAANWGSSHVNAKLGRLSSGILAQAWLTNGRCPDSLGQEYNSNVNWRFPLAIGTGKHETGHTFGLNHTPNDRNSLMYPSMNGQIKMNGTDIAQMKRIGYKFLERPPVPNWSAF